MQFVDSNVFLCYLTQDSPRQAQACYELFQKAQRLEITLTTSEAIVAEVVYVLSSKVTYNLSPEQIRSRLYPLLSVRGLKIPYRRACLRALDIYATYKLDFEDALAIAQMERQKLTEIYSYDHDFNGVSSITRIEP